LLLSSVLFIPLALALHGLFFHHDLRLGPLQVAQVVAASALLPMAVGALTGRAFPRAVEPLARHAGRFVNAVLLIVVVAAVVVAGPRLLAVGVSGWLTCALVATMAVIAGHVMGGPDPGTRGVLAALSAIRFPGLALLIASATGVRRELVPVVVVYLLASTVVTTLYAVVTKAVARRHPVAAPPQGRGAAGETLAPG
jgi:BASS family bile acid:Na+ symporter